MGVMKAAWALGAVVAGVTTLHALKIQETGTISGKLSPNSGAQYVQAINGTDTVKTVVAAGIFVFKLRPGHYKVVVDAIEPLHDAVIEHVEVLDGQISNLGEISLH